MNCAATALGKSVLSNPSTRGSRRASWIRMSHHDNGCSRTRPSESRCNTANSTTHRRRRSRPLRRCSTRHNGIQVFLAVTHRNREPAPRRELAYQGADLSCVGQLCNRCRSEVQHFERMELTRGQSVQLLAAWRIQQYRSGRCGHAGGARAERESCLIGICDAAQPRSLSLVDVKQPCQANQRRPAADLAATQLRHRLLRRFAQAPWVTSRHWRTKHLSQTALSPHANNRVPIEGET